MSNNGEETQTLLFCVCLLSPNVMTLVPPPAFLQRPGFHISSQQFKIHRVQITTASYLCICWCPLLVPSMATVTSPAVITSGILILESHTIWCFHDSPTKDVLCIFQVHKNRKQHLPNKDAIKAKIIMFLVCFANSSLVGTRDSRSRTPVCWRMFL